MHSIFEEMRRANADWDTASPLETLNEEELVRLAEEAGMSVEELCHHLATPHVEMSCPLCGRPSTHLIGCKGCGGDAWGWEFEEAHGEEARDQLRQHLRKLLLVANEVMPDQVEHALKHAFAWGGCMVCNECWHNTLPYDAYLSCPLNLLADRRLRPGYSPKGTYWLPQGPLILELREEREAAIQCWLEATWQRWTQVWNTAPAGPERDAIKEWRGALLYAALMDEPAQDGQDDRRE
jgi:hypothetical protein